MTEINNKITSAILQHAVIEFLDSKNKTQKSAQKTAVTSLASAALKGNDNPLKNSGSSGIGMENAKINKDTITVQYNPNSISFSAAFQEKTASEQEGDYMVTTVSAVCTITMQVELIFYSDEIVDAPILPQMELFLNTMKKNSGRKLRFSWADIVFEGEAVSIEVKYDMFNSKGNPISSKVKLSIQGKMEDNTLKKAYKKMEKERQNIDVRE